MAKYDVKFSSGGKLTLLGRSVKNVIRRMQTQARKYGTTVDTKSIRNQVREMVSNRGLSEHTVADQLNKIRDERLREQFVNKKTGERTTNISDVTISVKDLLKYHLKADETTANYFENSLISKWIEDIEDDYGDELDTILQANAEQINEALNRVIYGYLERGITQNLSLALERLYEAIEGTLSFNRKMAIEELVQDYDYQNSYGVGVYENEETEF